ncbi:MAG TPA: hypothetical protein VF892_07715, partial [Pseudonocardiaceae bacterium]
MITTSPIAAQRVGQAQARHRGTRRMATARTNPAATSSSAPTLLSVASSVPPRFPVCRAAVQPGSACRHASRSNRLSTSPSP